MWIFLGCLVGLPLLAIVVIRLFFFEQWIQLKLDWYTSQGRSDRALPLVKAQFQRLRGSEGEDHIATNAARYSLGQIQYENGLKEDGRAMVDKATEFFTRYQGPKDALFTIYLMNLGLAQRAIDRGDQAIESLQMVLSIQRNKSPLNVDEVARTLLNLGAMLEEAGRQNEAVKILEESLQMRVSKYGQNSIEVAKVKLNLAEALIGLEKWTEAERNLRQAIEVLKIYPTQDLGNAYDTYARLMEAQDRLVEAEPMRQASTTALQRALGEKSVEVAKQMEKQAALLGRLNRYTEQGLYEKKATEIREALKCTVS